MDQSMKETLKKTKYMVVVFMLTNLIISILLKKVKVPFLMELSMGLVGYYFTIGTCMKENLRMDTSVDME